MAIGTFPFAAMTHRFAPAGFAIACACLAGSAAGAGYFADDCAPHDIAITWPYPDVPDIPPRARGDLPPLYIDVPAIPRLVSTLELEYGVRDAPLLAAQYRPTIALGIADRPLELPPSRGAPWLPNESLPVPEIAAPFRGELLPATAPPPDLAAPSRALELGERYGPVLDDSLACAPALVIASSPCRTAARARVRGIVWPPS